jgi:hypothetical protein
MVAELAAFVAVAGAIFGAVVGVGPGPWPGVMMEIEARSGIIRSFTVAEWALYEIARIWLALHHWPRCHPKAFLADAHRRGVLRQAGAAYPFRHVKLQHRPANRDANE